LEGSYSTFHTTGPCMLFCNSIFVIQVIYQCCSSFSPPLSFNNSNRWWLWYIVPYSIFYSFMVGVQCMGSAFGVRLHRGTVLWHCGEHHRYRLWAYFGIWHWEGCRMWQSCWAVVRIVVLFHLIRLSPSTSHRWPQDDSQIH
jgi:hypothetical protein